MNVLKNKIYQYQLYKKNILFGTAFLQRLRTYYQKLKKMNYPHQVRDFHFHSLNFPQFKSTFTTYKDFINLNLWKKKYFLG